MKLHEFFTHPIADYIAGSIMFTLAEALVIYAIFNFASINEGDTFTVVSRYFIIGCPVILMSWMGIYAIKRGRSKR